MAKKEGLLKTVLIFLMQCDYKMWILTKESLKQQNCCSSYFISSFNQKYIIKRYLVRSCFILHLMLPKWLQKNLKVQICGWKMVFIHIHSMYHTYSQIPWKTSTGGHHCGTYVSLVRMFMKTVNILAFIVYWNSNMPIFFPLSNMERSSKK